MADVKEKEKEKEKEQSPALEEKEEKKYGKFQWFVMVILIPLIFTITLALIIMTIAGINVFDKAKEYGQHVPFVSQFIPGSKDYEIKNLKKREAELKATIAENEKQIKQLEGSSKNKQTEVDKLNKQIKTLNAKLKNIGDGEDGSTGSIQLPNSKKKQTLDDIVKSFENMSAGNAASIIPQLPDEDAVTILSSLKVPTLTALLEKMPPKDAAKYTALLTTKARSKK